MVGGWQPGTRFGQPVQVITNMQQLNYAVVVDDGRGKEKLSVIYEDDESL